MPPLPPPPSPPHPEGMESIDVTMFDDEDLASMLPSPSAIRSDFDIVSLVIPGMSEAVRAAFSRLNVEELQALQHLCSQPQPCDGHGAISSISHTAPTQGALVPGAVAGAALVPSLAQERAQLHNAAMNAIAAEVNAGGAVAETAKEKLAASRVYALLFIIAMLNGSTSMVARNNMERNACKALNIATGSLEPERKEGKGGARKLLTAPLRCVLKQYANIKKEREDEPLDEAVMRLVNDTNIMSDKWKTELVAMRLLTDDGRPTAHAKRLADDEEAMDTSQASAFAAGSAYGSATTGLGFVAAAGPLADLVNGALTRAKTEIVGEVRGAEMQAEERHTAVQNRLDFLRKNSEGMYEELSNALDDMSDKLNSQELQGAFLKEGVVDLQQGMNNLQQPRARSFMKENEPPPRATAVPVVRPWRP